MKLRVITAAVTIPILLLLLLAAPKVIVAVVWGAVLAVSSYELLYVTGMVREIRLVVYASAMAFIISVWSYFEASYAVGILILLAYICLLFLEMMLSHVKITFDKLCLCLVAGALIPFLQSSLIRILSMKIGRYLVLIPFIVAFLSDGGAYFIGKFFGKHKLAPVISQHKTIEGAFGGVLCAVLGMVIYTVVLQFAFDFRVNYLFAVFYGVVGAAAGVFGDLCFSVIKRQTGLKDYGSIIPGHGGVLDRFDSMMLVAPLIEVLLAILPVAV